MKNVIIFSLIFLVTIAGCISKDSKVKNESDVETIVINLNKESYDEYIGRGRENPANVLTEGIKPGEEGWLGNPHPIGWCDICGEYHTRKECIEKFKQDFHIKLNSDLELKKQSSH